MSRTSSTNCDTITLADGRELVFTALGPRDGVPVFYCHGAIGTPVQGTVDLGLIARRLGIRYVTPFRPGVGGSDPLPGRTICDHADDLRQLADRLALERISLVGVSAGAPYALAAAHRLGARVSRVAVCSSVSPFWPVYRTPGVRRRLRAPLAVLAAMPDTCRLLGDAVLPLLNANPGIVTRVIAAHAAPTERRRLAGSSEHTAVCDSFLAATAGGAAGLIDDYRTYARGWGFDLAAVEAEVHMWHGAKDPLVPIEHALKLAASLPCCRVFVDPHEGHHFFRSALPQILETLTADLSPNFRVSRLERTEGALAA
jgi:pimeloyl-ACP methyl ester carboxylesterase